MKTAYTMQIKSMRGVICLFALQTVVSCLPVHAATIVWDNASLNNRFSDAGNWVDNVAPGSGDLASIDLSGSEKAVFSVVDGTYEVQRIYVGTAGGQTGELDVTGGNLRLTYASSTGSRIGAAGGTGILNQSGGLIEFGQFMDIGRVGSTGIYNLSGGTTDVFRTYLVGAYQTSLQIGNGGGTGTMNITGGQANFRGAVQVLGSGATFRVGGSAVTGITSGLDASEGYWYQSSGAVLETQVDAGGLTSISILKATDDFAGGDVVFDSGAVLNVGFLDNSDRAGSWDVMTWDGTLTDNGLVFASGVDTNIWSFSFVDTDSSGSPDTLRITALARQRIKLVILH